MNPRVLPFCSVIRAQTLFPSKLRDVLWVAAMSILLFQTHCGRSGFDGTNNETDGGTEPIFTEIFAFVPSHVGDRVPFDAGSASIVVGSTGFADWVIDTDDGTITGWDGGEPLAGTSSEIRSVGLGEHASGITFQIIPGNDGTTLAVLAVERLEIPNGTSIVATGNHALIVLSNSEIHVDGLLTVGANRLPGQLYPGPGGFPGGSDMGSPGDGPGGGAGVPALDMGGAGGGHGEAGALGGGNGSAAGTINGDTNISVLRGGSGGGAGVGDFGAGDGGNGGGAILLAAREQVTIGLNGRVDAAGGSGRGAGPSACGHCSGGGGGGGAGGAIMLEAPSVIIDGFLSANGGGGGRGFTGDIGPIHGENGRIDSTPALGSDSVAGGGGGGHGSNATGVPEMGSVAGTGGGGGGAGGRIRIHTEAGDDTFAAGLLPTQASGLATVGQLQPAE